MSNQKGFSKIAIIIIVLILIVGSYFIFSKKEKNIPTQTTENQSSQSSQSIGGDLSMSDWKTYRNEEYGFEFIHPSNLILRDGNKDYKATGLDNFYQFCNKVIAVPDDQPLGPNDNFVGSCDGEFFRVNIWNHATGMKMIANDFAMLKLDKENKITIGDKTASDFIYSGYSDILEGMHTWHLFVVKTNNYIYSITGNSCMDDHNKCNQILSTFKIIH